MKIDFLECGTSKSFKSINYIFYITLDYSVNTIFNQFYSELIVTLTYFRFVNNTMILIWNIKRLLTCIATNRTSVMCTFMINFLAIEFAMLNLCFIYLCSFHSISVWVWWGHWCTLCTISASLPFFWNHVYKRTCALIVLHVLNHVLTQIMRYDKYIVIQIEYLVYADVLVHGKNSD